MAQTFRLIALALLALLSLQAILVSAQDTYYVFSKLSGNPNVGIFFLGGDEPVRLAVDLVEWTARPKISGGGPTRLSVGPYRFSGERNGEVFASNNAQFSRDWFLIPSNSEQYFLIAADPRGNLVWTAGEKHEPLKIKPFTGGDDQLFTFKPE